MIFVKWDMKHTNGQFNTDIKLCQKVKTIGIYIKFVCIQFSVK